MPDIEYCWWIAEKGVLLNDGYELKSKFFIEKKNVKDKQRFEHPTIKPLAIVERHLKHATQENAVILDMFMGSGTTAVAIKNIGGGREFLGFEISKKYYEIANNRLNGIEASGQMSFFIE